MLKKQEIYLTNKNALNPFINLAQLKAQELYDEYNSGSNALLTKLAEPCAYEAMKAQADRWQDYDLVFVGIGGSILSPGLFRAFATSKVKISCITAPDSASINNLLASLDVAKTRFVIISKSGKTAETLAVFLHLFSWLKNKNLNPNKMIGEMIIAICVNNDNPLQRFCKTHSIPCFYADAAIDSRFSLWTPVGLLPAYLMGLDGEAIRLGAMEYVADFFTRIENNKPHPLLAAAAWSFWGGKNNKNIHVLIHNNKRLHPIALWWRQLFAESLGKNALATTPLIAELPEDLHIRFQLYLDGRDDKIFTLLSMPFREAEEKIKTYGEPSLEWIEGSSLNQLLLGQENTAKRSLMRAHRPLRVLTLEPFSSKSYGALTAHFVLEILLIAKMWEVKAFGQPAIERGKKELLCFIDEVK